MEPTRPISGTWQSDEPPLPAGWWKASDGNWYPPIQATAPQSPPTSYGWPPPQGPRSYGQPQGQTQWGVPLWETPKPTGSGFSVTGIVLGVIAFLIVPPLFGIAGLVFGGIGLSKKEKLAPVAMIVAGLGLVGGMIIGAVVYTAVNRP